MTNIIGDIAGNYNTLMTLLDQMPEGKVISVGDMVDRGPRSKDVVEWFMKNGTAILGNHEHMMVDHLKGTGYYGSGIWHTNGGGATLESFGYQVPEEVITWLEFLPLYIEQDGVIISHSFLSPAAVEDKLVLEEDCKLGRDIEEKGEATIIWNRRYPVRRERWKLQICGHNSQFGLREWEDEDGVYAMCLDDSRNERLTGLHLETMTVYQQDYID